MAQIVVTDEVTTANLAFIGPHPTNYNDRFKGIGSKNTINN